VIAETSFRYPAGDPLFVTFDGKAFGLGEFRYGIEGTDSPGSGAWIAEPTTSAFSSSAGPDSNVRLGTISTAYDAQFRAAHPSFLQRLRVQRRCP
jgi:hypothetical protein